MKNIVLFSLAFISLLAFSSCRKHRLKGEGSIISDTRSLGAIESVEADGDIDLEIIPSERNKVVITGYENLVPAFESNVRSRTLVLKFNDTYYNVKNNNIRITLYVNYLEGVTLNGSGDVVLKPRISSDDMYVKINGSGAITIEDNDIPVMEYKINGSGNIYARDCRAQDVYANISGSGEMEVYADRYLEAKISGSGTINYWGDPETVNTDISGSGRVKKH